MEQDDYPAALRYQRQGVTEIRRSGDSLALSKALATLAVAEAEAGNVAAGHVAMAEAVTIARELDASQHDDASRKNLAMALGMQSWVVLLDGDFKTAIAIADNSLALDPSQHLGTIIRANGYLLAGQFAKAQAMYRAQAQDTFLGGYTFSRVLSWDFKALRRRGIDHPDMKRIEALLKGGGKSPVGPKGRK